MASVNLIDCDRCGESLPRRHALKEPIVPDGWVQLRQTRKNAFPAQIDLCPGCVEAFSAWLAPGKTEDDAA